MDTFERKLGIKIVVVEFTIEVEVDQLNFG